MVLKNMNYSLDSAKYIYVKLKEAVKNLFIFCKKKTLNGFIKIFHVMRFCCKRSLERFYARFFRYNNNNKLYVFAGWFFALHAFLEKKFTTLCFVFSFNCVRVKANFS